MSDGTTQEPAGLFGVGSDGMPPWVPRLLTQLVVIVVLFLFGWAVVRQLRGFLILLLISFFLSTAFEPGVAYLANRGWKRGAATSLLFFTAFVISSTFIGLMIPLIVDQTLRLVDQLPSYVDQLSDFAAEFGIEFSGQRLTEALTNVDSSLQGFAGDVAGSVFGVGTRLLNTVFQLLAIALFTFYITADAPRWRRALLSILPAHRQREVVRALDIAIDKTGGYFYSRALLAIVAALVTWGVFTILGVPFALPLGIWVGIFSQFVPVVGTYIGGLLPILIALLESPGMALGVLIYVVVYQQVENYLLAPRITSHTMSLHPAVAFGSALIGATLLGAPGAIMALPTAATIQAFVSTYLERHTVVESHLTNVSHAPPALIDREVDGVGDEDE